MERNSHRDKKIIYFLSKDEYMKKFYVFLLLVLFTSCSFDNKTGIWNSGTQVKLKDSKFEDFETLNSTIDIFDEIIKPQTNLNLKPGILKNNLEWKDQYYKSSNNLDNFSFSNLNELTFKSKKLSNHDIFSNLLFDGENILTVDKRGTIVVYSLDNEKIMLKYNFYKKKFKKLSKKLNVTIEKNIIYVADSLGYFYALDYTSGNIIWAKNFKVPFRSNLKIIDQNILASDINNYLYFIRKKDGERIKFIPTEKSSLKNNFINSLSSNNDTVFFLNTFGSIYSIKRSGRINWFTNLNRSKDIDQFNSFYSKPIVLYGNKIIISAEPYLYVLDINNGAILFKEALPSIVKPIVSGSNLFLITKQNLLVAISLTTNKILYSIKINKEISEFLNSKEKPISIKTFAILNNTLFVILNNSYYVNFSLSGEILDIDKLPSKIHSEPIFIDDAIIYLNKKKKLIVVN